MPITREYWFKAKRYGWGWGLPARWQGWIVFAAYLATLLAAGATLLPEHRVLAFNLVALFATLALVGVCLLTGEPPKWRWGEDDRR